MRINSEVETKWRDMTGEIHIPETSHCPNQIKKICENILSMRLRQNTELDFKFPQYQSMTKLDKILMIMYWREYDRLNDCIDGYIKFDDWFMNYATECELIRRSRQFLIEHHAVFVDSKIAENAQTAGDNFRHSVKSRC